MSKQFHRRAYFVIPRDPVRPPRMLIKFYSNWHLLSIMRDQRIRTKLPRIICKFVDYALSRQRVAETTTTIHYIRLRAFSDALLYCRIARQSLVARASPPKFSRRVTRIQLTVSVSLRSTRGRARAREDACASGGCASYCATRDPEAASFFQTPRASAERANCFDPCLNCPETAIAQDPTIKRRGTRRDGTRCTPDSHPPLRLNANKDA